MRKNKWYWVIGVMTAVALGITLDMYYHTTRKQRGELLSLIAVIVSILRWQRPYSLLCISTIRVKRCGAKRKDIKT